jgi:hypothetical protein
MVKITILLFFLLNHPVHNSMLSITQERGSDTVSLFLKMSYSDFLLDYSIGSGKGELNSLEEREPSDEDVNKYVNLRVNIQINNKLLKAKLTSQNLNKAGNEIILRLYCISKLKPELVEVKNEIMTKLYADQANMTIVKFYDFEEGVSLTAGLSTKTFAVKKPSALK